jgi:hypothetical protein
VGFSDAYSRVVALLFLRRLFAEDPRYASYKSHTILRPNDFIGRWLSSPKLGDFTGALEEVVDKVRSTRSVPDFITIHCNGGSVGEKGWAICKDCPEERGCGNFLLEVYEVKHCVGEEDLAQVREKELKQEELRRISLK